jgi:hypothetical protein
MGPPEIFVVLLMLLFGALVAGIGFLVVFVIMKVSRQKVRAKTMVIIVVLFGVMFLLSTIWVREVRNRVSVQIFGHEPYQGTEFSYGFPLAFMGIFRPDDISVQYLYALPIDFSLQNFMIDFILWLSVSTIIVLVVQHFRNHGSEQEPSQSRQ